MSTFASTSNQVAVLKELYSDFSYLQDLVYGQNPFMALVPKNQSVSGMSGKYLTVPTIYGPPAGGRSATFTNAQGNQTAPGVVSFFVYRTSNYQLATINK